MAYDLKTGWPGVGPATGTRLDDLIDEFLDAAERGNAGDRSGRPFTRDALRELRWCMEGHVREELGTLGVREVRRDDLEALVFGLGDRGVSPRRLRAIVKSVRAMYDYAVDNRLARTNPAERVALPEEPQIERPVRHGRRRTTRLDGMVSGALRLGTLGFALLALFFIAQSL
jgi:hypothetical protein